MAVGGTGGEYRLPSEAEWEYAARAGTTTRWGWNDEKSEIRANCQLSCGDQWDYTAPACSFRANRFGLYGMHGNVREWVADCWNASYAGAPTDGTAWLSGNCSERVLRDGSWRNFLMRGLRAANRSWIAADDRNDFVGFRVARTLAP